MHELFLIKDPETLEIKTFTHPVTIMTRAPVAVWIKPLFAFPWV